MSRPHGQASFPLFLLLAFLAIASLLAIRPLYPRDWALENLIVVATLPVLVYGYRHLRFSNASYLALFVLYVAHEVDAHYTYAEVPYDSWTMKSFGFSVTDFFGFPRNHYDRLVHFLYGLLVTPAVLELLAARARPRGVRRWILSASFVLSHAALYELLEWAAAVLFGGDLGQPTWGRTAIPGMRTRTSSLRCSEAWWRCRCCGSRTCYGPHCRRWAPADLHRLVLLLRTPPAPVSCQATDRTNACLLRPVRNHASDCSTGLPDMPSTPPTSEAPPAHLAGFHRNVRQQQ